MAMSMRVLTVVMALIWIFAGSYQAYAWGKHAPKPARVQRHAGKNSSPYAYLAPRKEKKPARSYRSTLGGQIIYGKKK